MNTTSVRTTDPLSWSVMGLYGLPVLVTGFMGSLMSLYLMKYATDVLLIPPAVLGTLFGLSRIWDAVTDPMVGYFSDRTRLRFGRRRSWILAGVLPTAATFGMLFTYPDGLTATQAVVWMAVAVFGFYTSFTLVTVPHLSWGAELSADPHQRSRLFGVRYGMITVGGMFALLCVGWLTSLESQGSSSLRSVASAIAVTAGVVMAACYVTLVVRLKERSDGFRRPDRGFLVAGREVLANPHARILLIVNFIEQVGAAAIGASALFVARYVMDRVEIAPYSIITYLVVSSLSVPLWVRLAGRYGKARVWLYSMAATAVTFGCMFTLAFVPVGLAQVVVLMVLSVIAGFFAGCGGALGPSLQSDVVDYDEYVTGERKEGAYFAMWNFSQKSAGGVTLMVTGFVLSAAGFVPNAEQTRTVQIALAGLLGLFPLICYTIGALVFTRFRLDARGHDEIRTALSARRQHSVPG